MTLAVVQYLGKVAVLAHWLMQYFGDYVVVFHVNF